MWFETLADILQNKSIHMLKKRHLQNPMKRDQSSSIMGNTNWHYIYIHTYLTWRTRSIERCCLMSLLNPSGKLQTIPASSTPLVAAQWWRSYLLTLFLRREGSWRLRIQYSRSLILSFMDSFFAVIECRNTFQTNPKFRNFKLFITSWYYWSDS